MENILGAWGNFLSNSIEIVSRKFPASDRDSNRLLIAHRYLEPGTLRTLTMVDYGVLEDFKSRNTKKKREFLFIYIYNSTKNYILMIEI